MVKDGDEQFQKSVLFTLKYFNNLFLPTSVSSSSSLLSFWLFEKHYNSVVQFST